MQRKIYDLMKVLTIEQKKSAFMAGNTLLQNKNALLDTFVKDMVDAEVTSITREVTRYIDELKRVRKTMGKEAAETFQNLMGSDVEARRTFIEKNAKFVVIVDV